MSSVVIGVLALQGSFKEHIRMVNAIPGAVAIEVRKTEQLDNIDGLIIPGGESTTMALVAEEWGLLTALQDFSKTDKPIWGTCAGLIFLAKSCTAGEKQGGQALIGTLNVEVARNFFGSQIDSFEASLPCPECMPEAKGYGETFRAVFIRAPAIMSVGEDVEVLSKYTLTSAETKEADGVTDVVVAVREGKLMATAFHPEITSDPRWHMLFVEMVKATNPPPRTLPKVQNGKTPTIDLPVY